jgi:hypothetical protein
MNIFSMSDALKLPAKQKFKPLIISLTLQEKMNVFPKFKAEY